VLAVLSGIRANARTHTELAVRDKAGPFVVLLVRAKRVAIDKTTDGVTISSSAMRVQLATFITLHHVDFGEIADTCDLNIVLSANKMNAFEGSVWNDASPPPTLRAPRNFYLLRVTDVANGRGRPQTKIVGVIHPHSLALRTLGRSGAAGVRARLADFGLLRELIVHVSSVPYLIGIAAFTVPDLDLVTVVKITAGQVHTSAMVSPSEMIVAIAGIVEILVWIARTAVPNLELITIEIISVRNIKAFCTVVQSDSSIRESPLLIRPASTVSHNYVGAICVVGSETLCTTITGLE